MKGFLMGHLKHRGLWLAVLPAFYLSPNSLPLVAQKIATQKPIKVDGAKLEGVLNFRDIGGYKAADGHTIRYNVLYRSAVLSGMTLADNETLAPLKIRYEIDLRTPAQRSQLPTNWGPNPPEVIDIPFLVGDAPPLQPSDNLDPAKVKANALRSYARYATLNAPTMGKVLHVLAQGDEPALLHCNGGKDRTGVTVAVLMTLLGASRQDVYREYLLSNAHAARAQPRPAAPAVPKAQRAQTVDVSLLNAFFHAIDTNYGSFDAYVRNGLKLSNEDVRNLRQRFLTD
jgi:protein-tyrosine phosphatase